MELTTKNTQNNNRLVTIDFITSNVTISAIDHSNHFNNHSNNIDSLKNEAIDALKNININSDIIAFTDTSLRINEHQTTHRISSFTHSIKMSSCVINHITSLDISNSLKIYYFIADIFASYNRSVGRGNNFTCPSTVTASKLGCSPFAVIKAQKQLESLGYLDVIRTRTKTGLSNVNIVTPTLPRDVFCDILKNTANKYCEQDSHLENSNLERNIASNERRAILQRTKQYIPINYELFEHIIYHKALSKSTKAAYLQIFSIIHKIKMSRSHSHYFATISLHDLQTQCNVGKTTIFKILKELKEQGLITHKTIYVSGHLQDNNRRDKILHHIELLVPQELAHIVKSDPLTKELFTPLNDSSSTLVAVRKKTRASSQKDTLYKRIEKKEKEIKKDIDRKVLSVFKNDSFSLMDFYPLSYNNFELLKAKSNKDISIEFADMILYNMAHKLDNNSIKRPVFTNKNSFIKYFSIALKYEYKQENPEIEKFFSQIESEAIYQRTDLRQLKAKLINVLPKNIAYKLVKGMSDFKLINDHHNYDHSISFVTPQKGIIVLSSKLAVKELAIQETHVKQILAEANAVYGNITEILITSANELDKLLCGIENISSSILENGTITDSEMGLYHFDTETDNTSYGDTSYDDTHDDNISEDIDNQITEQQKLASEITKIPTHIIDDINANTSRFYDIVGLDPVNDIIYQRSRFLELQVSLMNILPRNIALALLQQMIHLKFVQQESVSLQDTSEVKSSNIAVMILKADISDEQIQGTNTNITDADICQNVRLPYISQRHINILLTQINKIYKQTNIQNAAIGDTSVKDAKSGVTKPQVTELVFKRLTVTNYNDAYIHNLLIQEFTESKKCYNIKKQGADINTSLTIKTNTHNNYVNQNLDNHSKNNIEKFLDDYISF